jgi:prepilin-type N-terminal cleavage/methylation domain-containing protein
MMARCKIRAAVRRAGFTLIELLISLVVGLALVGAALSLAVSVFRGSEGDKLREEVYRSGRFVGMSLQRDVQTTGVGIESSVTFGTLSTFGDTLVILHVPWEPAMAPAYSINPPFGVNNPLDPGGTCGATCLDLNKDALGNYDLAEGDLARLQVNAERHLIIITGVRDLGLTFQITFLPGTEILHYEAAFEGGLLLDRFATTVQKLQPIVYFAEDSTLFRADRFDVTGNLIASPMSYGVVSWDADMIFTDLDEAANADLTDADVTNDFDDILGVRIVAMIGTNRPDIRVAGGGQFARAYDWRLTPRNLMYERNR